MSHAPVLHLQRSQSHPLSPGIRYTRIERTVRPGVAIKRRPVAQLSLHHGPLGLLPLRKDKQFHPLGVGLADELVAEAKTPFEIARRVEAYLAQNLRYSLDLGRQTDRDPLDEFLFERKAGNCEYFAASMAVLLRASGVPARVVNGFQQGEWNEAGRYFIVRQRDAHSWVEVFFPAVGWVTFDPSPRSAFDAQTFSANGWLAQHIDALRMRWTRYVVDYNAGDQVLFAMKLQRQSAALRSRLTTLGESSRIWEEEKIILERVWRPSRRTYADALFTLL